MSWAARGSRAVDARRLAERPQIFEQGMSQHFQYRGTLEETSLAEMFYTIFRHRVPGLIEITNGTTVKRITIRDGLVLHASSSDRADRLGAFLYRSGKLSRKTLEETMRRRRSSNTRHGQIMIEDGLLSPGELFQAIRGQMEAIVWSVFAWKQGEVTFQIGERPAPSVRIHLPMRQVVLRGVKHVPDVKALVAQLGRRDTVMTPSYDIEDLLEIALDQDEYRLLRLVDGARSIYDICSQGPFSVAENARLLYAYHVLRLVQSEEKSDSSTGTLKIRLDADRKLSSS